MSTPLSPSLVIASATVLLGMREDNRRRPGALIEAMLREVGQPPDAPWSAAFIHHAGYWGLYEHEGRYSSWPLPRSGSVTDLALFAHEKNILKNDQPREGDVAIIWDTQKQRFVQAGFVIEAKDEDSGVWHTDDGKQQPYFTATLIEGNTDIKGALGGPGVYRVRRTFMPEMGDRFVRWVDLDSRGATGDPTIETEQEMGRITVRRAA